MAGGRLGASPQAGRENLTGAADQHGHLIGDEAHVAGGASQHRQAGTVADRHDHQQTPVHLDHRLFDQTAIHTAGTTLSQAGQPRGDGGEPVGFRPVQARWETATGESVGRHDHGVGHPGVRLAKL